MHSLKKWMDEKWISENCNNKMRDFIVKQHLIEDPLIQNNPGKTITVDLTTVNLHQRLKMAEKVFSIFFNKDDFYFCEYGAIGIDKKKRYIIGNPNKENCFEFKSKNKDIWYCYDNITYLRVKPKTFRFYRYIKDVIYKNHFWNSYYFIDLKNMIAVRMYDERGMAILFDDEIVLQDKLLLLKELNCKVSTTIS